jgi:Tol biopolymer transport system component
MKKLSLVAALAVAASCDQHSSLLTPTVGTPAGSSAVRNVARTFYGPEQFSRGRGAPDVHARTISTAGFEGPFVLHVRNGGTDGTSRVSSARITIDGQELLGVSALSQQAGGYDLPVVLAASSVLEVKLAGLPGAYLEISIEGVPSAPPTYGLVFSEADGTGLRRLITQRSDGSERRVLATHTNDFLGLIPRYSPDGTQIVYQVGQEQFSDLYLADATGAVPPVNLTPNSPWLHNGSTIAADGRIVFGSARSGNYELWMRMPDGTTTQLTRTAVEEGQASLSPDGSQIAFARGNGFGTGRDIWIMNLTLNPDGSRTERQVTAIGGYSSFPRWTPDGRLLISHELGLHFVDVSADRAPLSALTRINIIGIDVGTADISPDGRKVVFVAPGVWDIYMVNVDGSGLQKVPTPDGLLENYPSFKPVR